MNKPQTKPEVYGRIFETARLNASLRIQELNESADLAAAQSMLRILRPAPAIRVEVQPKQAVTDRPNGT